MNSQYPPAPPPPPRLRGGCSTCGTEITRDANGNHVWHCRCRELHAFGLVALVLAILAAIFSCALSHAETGPCELNARSRRLAAQALQEKAAQLSPLVLVNASTGADLAPLVNGTNDLPQLDGVNVRYDAPAGTQSVKFKYDTRTSIENAAPFALFGDANGRYNAGSISAGAHTITGTAYSRKNARGKIVGSVNVKADFQVTPGPTPNPTPTPDPNPVPPPTPDPTPAPAGVLTGYFALQPGDTTSRALGESQLRLAGVSGLTIRIRPQWISVNGKWDFSFIDQCVARCKSTNRKYKLLLMGGGDNPLAESTLQFYEAAAAALGSRYSSDPLCAGAHATGASPASHSEELFWGNPMPADAKAAAKRMIDAWSKAFPRQTILLAGTANDAAAMRELIAYGLKAAPGRFLYKNNALSAKSPIGWASNQLVVEAGKAGAQIGWEMLDNSSASRYGGSLQTAINTAKELARQAGNKPWYADVYQGDLSKLGSLK